MRTARGVTLIELMIALGVTAVAMAGAVIAVGAQERAYQAGHRTRAAQNSARTAVLFLEQKAILAGYGMDAPLALDFGWYVPAATCPGELAPCARDRTDDSDELVFYYRNPSYWVDPAPGAAMTSEPRGRGWGVDAVAGDIVTLKARQGDVFPAGQILQAVCAGELRFAYFTVATTTTAAADGPLAVELRSVVTADPFRRQDVLAALPCVAPAITSTLKVFQIDRYRYHVRPIDVGNGRYDPYLMLDMGVDRDGDGDVDGDDEEFIAEGIESLQVGYVFSEPALPVAGTVPGTPIAFPSPAVATADQTPQTIVRTLFPGAVPVGGFEYEPSSFFKYSLVKIPPERQTNAQANIRRLVISVVARSPDQEISAASNLAWTAGSNLFQLNQDAAPPWITNAFVGGGDGYTRAVATTSILLPNMTTRTVTYY